MFDKLVQFVVDNLEERMEHMDFVHRLLGDKVAEDKMVEDKMVDHMELVACNLVESLVVMVRAGRL